MKELQNFKGVVIYESFSGVNEVNACFFEVDQPLAPENISIIKLIDPNGKDSKHLSRLTIKSLRGYSLSMEINFLWSLQTNPA